MKPRTTRSPGVPRSRNAVLVTGAPHLDWQSLGLAPLPQRKSAPKLPVHIQCMHVLKRSGTCQKVDTGFVKSVDDVLGYVVGKHLFLLPYRMPITSSGSRDALCFQMPRFGNDFGYFIKPLFRLAARKSAGSAGPLALFNQRNVQSGIFQIIGGGSDRRFPIQ